jgi:hypothetical protein
VFGRIFLSVIIGRIRFRINHSIIFPKKGRRLIGRCDEGRSDGLFGYGNNIIVANFQSSGK